MPDEATDRIVELSMEGLMDALKPALRKLVQSVLQDDHDASLCRAAEATVVLFRFVDAKNPRPKSVSLESLGEAAKLYQ